MPNTLKFPVESKVAAPPPEQLTYRRSMIETGIGGTIRFVYRDENGYILLDWGCPATMGDESRRMIRRAQELAGERLAALTGRVSLLGDGPRLLP